MVKEERNGMKHQKNMLCLGLAAVLSLSLLTACSGGNSAATPAPADTTAPTDTAAPADTTAPAGFTTVEEGKLHMSTNASLHHLPVANLKSTFRVAAGRAAAYFDFIIIGFKVFRIVV